MQILYLVQHELRGSETIGLEVFLLLLGSLPISLVQIECSGGANERN